MQVSNGFFFEELEKSPEIVRDYVRLVRTAYPNYWVRALNQMTGEVITSYQTD